MLSWIKLEPGCEMPDYDLPVIWQTEDGNHFVRDIDKDDNDWWNGKEYPDALKSYPRCTHWAKISFAEEEPDQNILLTELEEEMHEYFSLSYDWGEISERLREILKEKYILIRK